MLLTPDHFAEAFEEIRKTSLTHSTCKLAIFTACLNVDAVCSARMLCGLLKKSLIVFQMIPVVGYNDLKKKYAKLDDTISNVIMLDCGSMVDLESFLEIDVNNYLDKDYYQSMVTPDNPSQLGDSNLKLTRKIYIIDGHRPWNLDNLFGSEMINCFDDGGTSEELEHEKEAYDLLVSMESDEEEDADSDSDKDGSDHEEELSNSSFEKDEQAEGNENQNQDEDKSQESRKRTGFESFEDQNPDEQQEHQINKKKRRTKMREGERTIENYYNQGTTVIIPSSLQMYTLLSTIGRCNMDNLWLSIVGATSLKANYEHVYDDVFPLLKEEVNRLQSEKQAEDNAKTLATTQNNTSQLELSKNMGDRADNCSIQIDKEYSLFLLRHWNMYDAFFYSNYVNSKLQLYTNQGRKKLNTMFARMGISLVSASQNWHYLDIDLKKKINRIFTKNLSQLGLTDVIRDGFVRNYGFDGAISAGDYAEAVTALLEFDGEMNTLSKFKEGGIGNDQTTPPEEEDANDETKHTDDDGKAESLNKLIIEREEQFIRNFWKAYDSLASINLVEAGIRIAQLQQKFIFEKGFEIFHKRMVKNLRIFRLVVLKNSFTSNSTVTDITINNYAPSRHSTLIGTSDTAASSSLNEKDTVDFHTLGSSQKLFQNPLILTKLGNWILEACAEMDTPPVPLVIAALDRDTDTYLVCGLPPKYPNMRGIDTNRELEKQSESTTVLNTFSLAFQEIANSTGAKARIDSFESTIIEIRKEDLPLFLERLTLSGLV